MQSQATGLHYTTITWDEYRDLQLRAADGDLVEQATEAWRQLTGEDLRTELAMLAGVWSGMRQAAACATTRRQLDRPAGS